jgi:uncharacterized membrane protein YfcA
MAIPAVVAVLIAAFIVKSLPLDSLRSVVMAVIIYTALNMLYNVIKSSRGKESFENIFTK